MPCFKQVYQANALVALALTGISSVCALDKPHVVLVLADDYGWANFGLHNTGTTDDEKQLKAEIHTPNLDRLAQEGVLLDRHYTFRICSPSRSSLISGRLPMHVNYVNTGLTDINPKDPVSGSSGIPRNMTGIATKMKEGGYRTHMVGKWDAGSLTPEHTPWGRGFESFFGFLQHANDYWQKTNSFLSTGEIDVCLDKFVDFSVYNETYKGLVNDQISAEMGCPMSTGHDPLQDVSKDSTISPVGCVNASYCLSEACYEEAQMQKAAVGVIDRHDVSEPLFLFFSTHLVHTPLQVPQSYLDKLDALVKESGGKPISTRNRRLYAAMVLYMDDTVAAVEKALRDKGMWDNTLMIFTSDNGGPIYEPGSANNYPHKGGKYSDWEGGIRTNAFVSGGVVPPSRRGSTFSGVVSIADWYGTLAEFAGVSQEDEAAVKANDWLQKQGLPLLAPVDSVPQWKHILEDTNGRADSLYISDKAVMRYPFKLVTGRQVYSMWAPPLHPNCTTIDHLADQGPIVPMLDDVKLFGERLPLGVPQAKVDALMDNQYCGDGCLFNVEVDPSEFHDLAGDAAHADVLKQLQADLAKFNEQAFNPDRGSPSMDACWTAMKNGGLYGPFVDADTWYTPVTLTPEEEKQNEEIKKYLEFVEKELLPDRQKAISWFETKVGDLTEMFASGENWDTCLDPMFWEKDVTTINI